MPSRAIALLSGGLDSMLAIRCLLEQGIEVEAVNFQTIFTCCKDTAARAARQLDVPLTVLGSGDDYIELVRRPQYGYGKGANPCVDCRIYMFRLAGQIAEDRGADFVVSGEVLGQRPMSQKRRDLLLIAQQSGLEGRLLRPLSARRLPPTVPEVQGWVDRRRLFGFVGRSRKPLIRLARHYGFEFIPAPSTGCSLTETSFAGRVHDLVQLDTGSGRWDFELLNLGRHFRLTDQTKAIVGRRESDNLQLQHLYRQPGSRAAAMLVPDTFPGPTVILVGQADESALRLAGGLTLRYAKHVDHNAAVVNAHIAGRCDKLPVQPVAEAESLPTL